ncbi:hypothetical protein [Neisseria iguanae]|uniref:hypothetical protein n=1 Tax=Neisseria iguanae TaxID=90242 RepID=UPI00147495A5|nr:hypothetical protein [Neisseria iguanae]
MLNRHVYIDTVVLVGGNTANPDKSAKQFFLMDAANASSLWFARLDFGSHLLLLLF